MDKIKKFDENFLEDESFSVRKKKDFDSLMNELRGNAMCMKERNVYFDCVKKKNSYCEEFKNSIFICAKNSGKLIN